MRPLHAEGAAPRLEEVEDPDRAIVVSAPLARRLRLHTGDGLQLLVNDERRDFRVRAIADARDMAPRSYWAVSRYPVTAEPQYSGE